MYDRVQYYKVHFHRFYVFNEDHVNKDEQGSKKK